MAEESSRPRVDTRFDFGETFKGKDGEVYRNRPAFRLNAKPENPTLRRLANKEPNRKWNEAGSPIRREDGPAAKPPSKERKRETLEQWVMNRPLLLQPLARMEAMTPS